jgi:hypothetical protein
MVGEPKDDRNNPAAFFEMALVPRCKQQDPAVSAGFFLLPETETGSDIQKGM